MAKWSRATYILVADKVAHHVSDDYDRAMLAHAFADEFAEDNPAFDRKRFSQVCNIV